MKFDQFTINRGSDYHKRQKGLMTAIEIARVTAREANEIVTVYADWTNYGYWIKPADGRLAENEALTAREIVYVRPDGSLAHVNRATVASTEAFIAAQIARIDTDQQVNPAAQALAASWIQ